MSYDAIEKEQLVLPGQPLQCGRYLANLRVHFLVIYFSKFVLVNLFLVNKFSIFKN